MAFINGNEILFSPTVNIIGGGTDEDLAEIKRAILSKGGNIAEEAEFADVPEAIYDLPVGDPSYLLVEDRSTENVKQILSGASKYANIDSIGGLTHRWEGLTYTASTDRAYSVDYPTPFTLAAGTYKLINGGGGNIYINGSMVANPFTLDQATEITSMWEEWISPGDGSTFTIRPYLLWVDCPYDISPIITFPNTWFGLQDSKPTEIRIHGVNLIPNTRDIYLHSAGGLTYIDNGDGSYYVSGTATGVPSYIAININKAFPASTYTFYGFSNGSKDTYRLRYMFNNKTVDVYNGGGVVAVLDKGCVLQQILLIVQNGITANNLLYYPMVVRDKQFNLPFMPYKEPKIIEIPTSIKALNGYGEGIKTTDWTISNFVDCENKLYSKQLETVVLDGVNNKFGTGTGVSNYGLRYFMYSLQGVDGYGLYAVICSHFVTEQASLHQEGGGFCYIAGNTGAQGVFFYLADQTIETVEAANAWLKEQNAQGTPVTFTWAKKEATTEALPAVFDDLIEVEAGGYIEFVTDTGASATSAISYLRRVE